jgi:hypothetical protein
MLRYGQYTAIFAGVDYYDGEECFKFFSGIEIEETVGIAAFNIRVKPNGELITKIPYNQIPNPYKLKFTGASVATYDGSSEVTVDIPTGGSGGGGIPDPGKAHQQLVSDKDGKAVWQERLAYKYVQSGMTTLFAEETLMIGQGEDEGDMFFSATPLTAMPEVGKQYEVTINGTVYTTTAHPLEDNGAVMGVMLGNAGTMNPDEHEDTGEPYTLVALMPAFQAMMGGMSLIMMSDLGAESVTLSIKGYATITTIKKIPSFRGKEEKKK